MLEPFEPFLSNLAIDTLRLGIWLGLLALIFLPLEFAFPARRGKILRKGLGQDIIYYFLGTLVLPLLLSIPVWAVATVAHRVVPYHLVLFAGSLPLWLRAILTLLVGELFSYWAHRWSHEVPFLWRFHAIHHSAEQVDFLVNTRSHPIDLAFVRFVSLVPLFMLGLTGPIGQPGSLTSNMVLIIGTIWTFFIHANIRFRFGFLEYLISTPGFHRWHHTLDGPVNHNYAPILPWMDWLFGTMHLPPHDAPVAYGTRTKVPDTVIGQLLWPLLPEPLAPTQAEGGDPA